jgi:methylglutaconyl-CoA hydratase
MQDSPAPLADAADHAGFELIDVRREGAVERVTLNRPKLRNAFNDRVIAELHTWARRTAASESVQTVVLAGAGKVFSAGADLEWMARGVDLEPDAILDEVRALHDMFEAIDGLPQPVIGRVQGAAIAGGAGLLAVCDVVVAADDAVFGFSEVKLGIIPAIISPFVIRKIGVSAARELFISGARFSASRAKEIGLVHRVVPSAHLDEVLDEYVAEMRTSVPSAMSAAKALIRNVAATDRADAFAVTGPALVARRISADGRAGIRRFLDERGQRRRDG